MSDPTQANDIYYRPLQNVVYTICNTISSKHPWIYHLAGLLLHIVVSFSLYKFLKELKYHSSVCLVFTLIYCVHPVLVQGVAWIAGVGDQIAALFSLLSVIYFIRLISVQDKLTIKYYFFHLLFLCAALFSKEISIAILPLCLLYLFLFNKNKARAKTFLMLVAGWFIITTVYLLVRNHAIPPGNTNLFSSALEALKVNGPLVFEYFGKVFLPYNLSPVPSREDAQLLIGIIIFLSLIAILVIKKRITPLLVFGSVLFVVFLLPTFIQLNPESPFYAFEHRLYLPLIGILIVLIELFNISRVNINSNYHKYGFSIILLLLFITSFSYSRIFSNPYAFYNRAITGSPKSVLAYNGYAKFLVEDKKYVEALEAYKNSFIYQQKDMNTAGKIADIYLRNLNNPREAINWFKKTLSIDSNSVEAAVSIGDVYFNFLHDTSNAIEGYQHALKIDPHNEFAFASLGVISASKGKTDEAIRFFVQSLEQNPTNSTALKWIAISYFNQGKITEAVNYLNKGYQLYPNDIDLIRNLMICYYRLKDINLTQKFASILF